MAKKRTPRDALLGLMKRAEMARMFGDANRGLNMLTKQADYKRSLLVGEMVQKFASDEDKELLKQLTAKDIQETVFVGIGQFARPDKPHSARVRGPIKKTK